MKVFTLIILLFSFQSNAIEVIKIEAGDDYKNYSNKDLKKRIWRLEKAVWQLQQKVFQLEGQSQNSSSNGDTWVCMISAMGDKYSATGGSKAVATHNVIEKCTKARGDGFFCKSPKCEN